MGGRCCPALSRNKGQNALEEGLVPLVGIYISKDLAQPLAGPVLAASASMSSLELFSVVVERFSLSCAVSCQFFCGNKKVSIEEAQLETVSTGWTTVCFVVVPTPRSNYNHLEVSHKMELISSQDLAKHSSPQPSFSLVG